MRRLPTGAVAALVALLVAGCGPAPGPAPGYKAETPEKAHEVQTGEVEIRATDPEGRPSWVANADETRLKLLAAGGSVAELTSVMGSIFQEGRTVSRFTADSGEADQTAKRLSLDGDVRVTAERDGLVLTAERITYADAEGLIQAEGNVRVTSDVYELGPFPRLVATPDLRRVGTPDRFRR